MKKFVGNSGIMLDGSNVKITEDGGSSWIDLPGKIYVATGNTDISTNSTDWVDMPDMSITRTFNAGDKLLIQFNAAIENTEESVEAWIRLLINGTEKMRTSAASGYHNKPQSCTLVWVEDITSTESYTIKIQWASSASGYTQNQHGSTYKRVLTVITGG